MIDIGCTLSDKQVIAMIILGATIAILASVVTYFLTSSYHLMIRKSRERAIEGVILDMEDASLRNEYLKEGLYRFQVLNENLGVVYLESTRYDPPRVWKFKVQYLPRMFYDSGSGLATYTPSVDAPIYWGGTWEKAPNLI